MNRLIKPTLAGLLLISTGAYATENTHNYTYLEVAIGLTDVHVADTKLEDFSKQFHGSFGFLDYFFIEAEQTNYDVKEKKGYTDLEFSETTTTYLLGGHYPITDGLDLIARFGKGNRDGEYAASTFNFTGPPTNTYQEYDADFDVSSIGARIKLSKNDFTLDYASLDIDGEKEDAIRGTLRVGIDAHSNFMLIFLKSDHQQEFSVGYRYSF